MSRTSPVGSGLRTGLVAAVLSEVAVAAGERAGDPDPWVTRNWITTNWVTTNWRQRRVSLWGGPAVVVAALAGDPTRARIIAGTGAVLAGRYDDLIGARPEQKADKGFRGHLAAARQGRLSAGAVKVLGIGATALLASAVRPGRGSVTGVVRDGLLLAGTANLVNLFDLRPGRALKVVGLVALGAGCATGDTAFVPVAAAVGAALPADVGESTMLGDAGANGIGILLGTAVLDATGPRGRLAWLAAVVALTAASERVSFSAVIDRTPVLAWLDGLGRV